MIQFLSALFKSNLPIYIAGHITPDQDSICSSMSLALFLNSCNKNTKVLLENNDKDVLSWKNDYSLIVDKIEEKDYIFIAVDVNEGYRLGNFESYYNNASITFNIDHHIDNSLNASYCISDTTSSSTCEIIYTLIKTHNINKLTKDIASYIYSGMLNDTNGFKRRLSSSTLSIAQELINKGIDYSYIINETLTNRSMYEMKALASLINEIEYDNFHYLIIDMKKEEYKNLTFNQITKKIAEDLRTIKDIDIFVILIKYEDYIKAKTMSRTNNDALIIAKLFNGGGHNKEAGFTIKNLDTIEIISRISDYLKTKLK